METKATISRLKLSCFNDFSLRVRSLRSSNGKWCQENDFLVEKAGWNFVSVLFSRHNVGDFSLKSGTLIAVGSLECVRQVVSNQIMF